MFYAHLGDSILQLKLMQGNVTCFLTWRVGFRLEGVSGNAAGFQAKGEGTQAKEDTVWS